jgi:hypoxanthine phosphoribosyltransferase
MGAHIIVAIPAETIATRVGELATQIGGSINGTPLSVIGMLTGAFVFTADLMRELHKVGVDASIDFITVESYGDGRTSAGEVTVVHEPRLNLVGQTVLIVDDIVDTGLTLRTMKERIEAIGAKRVLTCALLDKPVRRKVSHDPDYVGFTVENRFMVGYGLDIAGRYRGLPYIGYIGDVD